MLIQFREHPVKIPACPDGVTGFKAKGLRHLVVGQAVLFLVFLVRHRAKYAIAVKIMAAIQQPNKMRSEICLLVIFLNLPIAPTGEASPIPVLWGFRPNTALRRDRI